MTTSSIITIRSPYIHPKGGGEHEMLLDEYKLDKNHYKPDKIQILCCEISHLSRTQIFFFCSIGIFIFYCAYAILQEFMFKRIEGFHFGMFTTFYQFVIYTIVSGIHRFYEDSNLKIYFFKPRSDASLWRYAICAFFSTATVTFSNVSCQYLNYPTQILFKSCKIIPVMFVGIIFLGKRYNIIEYLSILILSSGLILFSVGDGVTHTKLDSIGVVLILSALLCDAFIGNLQEHLLTSFKNSSITDVIYFSRLIGSIILFFSILYSHELFDALNFIYQNPSTLISLTLFSCVGTFGEFFVMAMMKRFGALLTVVITSTRKFSSIFLSFLVFPKPFTFIYFLGVILVFTGIGLKTYIGNQETIQKCVKNFFCSKTKSKQICGKFCIDEKEVIV